MDTEATSLTSECYYYPGDGCHDYPAIMLTVADSRNRQVVTSIAIPEAGTACSEDIVAHARRGRNGKEVRDTYLSTP